jgi:hypothetical protein
MTGIANATEAEAERETDIEITPEMTRAGAAVIAELGGECDSFSLADEVYKAMAALAPPRSDSETDRNIALRDAE